MSRSKGSARSYALFDIGASSIGVGLGVCTVSGVALLWHARIDFAFLREEDYVRYEKSMYAALLELGMRMVSEGVSVASRNPQFTMRALSVTCVFGPPWFLGSVIEDGKSAHTPFAITHGSTDELHATMFKSFLATAESVSWSQVMGAPELLEQHDLGVWLDGYPVTAYKEREARECRIRTYLALAAQSVTEHVRDILHRVVPNHTLTITSSTWIFIQGVRAHNLCTQKRHSILIDIGGQLSNIILIRNGVCVGTKTIPYGENDLLLAIAPDAANAREAYGAYTVYEKQYSIINPQTKHTDAFEAAGAVWQTAIVEALGILSQGVTIPRTVLLSAAEFYAPYARFLTKPVWLPGIRSEQSFEVTEYPIRVPERAQSTIGTHTDERLVLFLKTVDESILQLS